MSEIHVIKRSGQKEVLDLEKIHKVVEAACEGLAGVSVSELELKSQLQFFNGMKTSDIQETLVKAASELITEDAPNYQYVAGRLVNYQLRKEVYGQYTPLRLYDMVKANVRRKLYSSELLDWYTEEDFDLLETIIDHNRDDNIAYAGMEQFRGKYLVKNRTTGQFFETPQVAYLLIAATIFNNTERYPNRMKWIKEYYDAISKFYISLASPIIGGLRTPTKQFSSCVLIDIDDSLDGITAGATAIVKYIAKRAGIGVNTTSIRDLGDDVNDGYASHTGKVPYIRFLQGATKSASQGGMRGGAATVNILGWSREIMEMMTLKNNKGAEDNRARGVDYVVQLNKVMYERLLAGADITLMSPSYKETPGLLDAFYSDDEKFKELYEKYERSPKVKKEKVKASEFFNLLLQERKDTGRIYIMNVDNANNQSMYVSEKAPIRMTNLCVEVLQNTVPLKAIDDMDGRISLCTLSAVNWGIIKTLEELSKYTKLASYALDEIISYQDYVLPQAEAGTMDFRSVGVGITNLAYWMAKHGLRYHDITDEGLALIDEWTESHVYGSIEGSIERAELWGPCRRVEDTLYKRGFMPQDVRKPAVDELTPFVERRDWTNLRERAIISGVRNIPNNCQMPTESSSQTSNSTNGIEPVRGIISSKKSKDGILTQVVPESRKLKNAYDPLWDQPSPNGYLKISAVIQKWFDSGMSVNTSYNPAFWDDGKLPMSVMYQDLINHYRWGGKTLYYLNTMDGAGEIGDNGSRISDEEVSSLNEEDCDSCKL